MSPRAENEIIELHQFFQDWFNGVLENTDKAFARFTDVMSEGFGIISPAGQISELDDLTDSLRAAYGSHGKIRIWIENIQLRRQDGRMLIATYEEWQQVGEEKSYGRVSTVVFRENIDMPNGLEWFHVHETWIHEHAE